MICRFQPMTEWDNEDWTFGAKRLVDWAATVNSEQPLMLMIRHSHREVLLTYEDTMGAGLTDLGKRVSVELGRRIPNDPSSPYFSECNSTMSSDC